MAASCEGFGGRQRADENRIDHAEDRSIDSDAQSQRKQCDHGETAILDQHANTVANILKQCVHGRSQAIQRRGVEDAEDAQRLCKYKHLCAPSALCASAVNSFLSQHLL